MHDIYWGTVSIRCVNFFFSVMKIIFVTLNSTYSLNIMCMYVIFFLCHNNYFCNFKQYYCN